MWQIICHYKLSKHLSEHQTLQVEKQSTESQKDSKHLSLNVYNTLIPFQALKMINLFTFLFFQLKFSKSKESNVTFVECDENNENGAGAH